MQFPPIGWDANGRDGAPATQKKPAAKDGSMSTYKESCAASEPHSTPDKLQACCGRYSGARYAALGWAHDLAPYCLPGRDRLTAVAGADRACGCGSHTAAVGRAWYSRGP